MGNKYKDPERDNLPEQTYITFPNPRKDGWSSDKYGDGENQLALDHFNSMISLRDRRGYEVTKMVGDFLHAVEMIESNGDESYLEELVDELTEE